MTFFETSAKTGLNVEEVFRTVAGSIKDKLGKGGANGPAKSVGGASSTPVESGTRLGAEEKKKKKKSDCCK